MWYIDMNIYVYVITIKVECYIMKVECYIDGVLHNGGRSESGQTGTNGRNNGLQCEGENFTIPLFEYNDCNMFKLCYDLNV
jgi:hypothetical protein